LIDVAHRISSFDEILIYERLHSLIYSVTLYPQDKSDANGLLRHADQAMYEAKQLGKNRYCFWKDIST